MPSHMPLSNRFTQYQKMRPQPSTVSYIRAVQQASKSNRRLVQQSANRPGNLKKMPVKQRLGPSKVKARLSINAVTGGGGELGSLGRGNGQRGGLEKGGNGGQGGLRCSPSSGGARVGKFWSSGGDVHGNRGRERGGEPNGERDGFGGDRRGRGANRGRGVERERFQRSGRGGVRGQRRGRRANVSILKEELDNQLKEYMSNTKAKLDQKFDTYMDQADS
jgi:hypothetical protein